MFQPLRLIMTVILASFCLPYSAQAFQAPLGPLGCGDIGDCPSCNRVSLLPKMPRLFGHCGVCQQQQCGCQPVMPPAPVIQPRLVPRQRVTYEMVPQTVMRQQAVTCQVPQTTYCNVTVDQGSWQRIWVPRYVTQAVPQTVMTQQVQYRQVPQTVMTRVPRVTTEYALMGDCQYSGGCGIGMGMGIQRPGAMLRDARQDLRQNYRYDRRQLRRPNFMGYGNYGSTPYAYSGTQSYGMSNCPDGTCNQGSSTMMNGGTYYEPGFDQNTPLSVPQLTPVLPYSVPGQSAPSEPGVPTPADQTTWSPVPTRHHQTAGLPSHNEFRIPSANAAAQYQAF